MVLGSFFTGVRADFRVTGALGRSTSSASSEVESSTERLGFDLTAVVESFGRFADVDDVEEGRRSVLLPDPSLDDDADGRSADPEPAPAPEPVESAVAVAAKPVATPAPMPRPTASAPTRPTNLLPRRRPESPDSTVFMHSLLIAA
ncbi:MAG: hypothetical protein ABWY45_04380 [Mycobacterium sp.]